MFETILTSFKPLDILSDGDLDGIFAVGLILQFADSQGIRTRYRYLNPDGLNGLTVEETVLVELSPSKGLLYNGRNVLIDHHDAGSGAFLYRNDEIIESFLPEEHAHSAAEVVYHLLRTRIELDAKMNRLLATITAIDNARYDNPCSRELHRAYLLNITNDGMRDMITECVREKDSIGIIEWAHEEAMNWESVEEAVEQLMKAPKALSSDSVYFVSNSNDSIQRVAVREAMLRLENDHDIVVSLVGRKANSDWMIDRGTIATLQDDIDFLPLFRKLRNHGATAGGRPQVGGFQFSIPQKLETVLIILERMIREIDNEDRK